MKFRGAAWGVGIFEARLTLGSSRGDVCQIRSPERTVM